MLGLLVACYLVVGFVPLVIAWQLIRRRARAARVQPFRFELVSGLASWVGVILAPATVLAVTERTDWVWPGSWPEFVVVPLLGWIGGTVGAWAGVICLRMATATDPDYGEGRAAGRRRSLEADVPEAGDGDHVRSD